MSGIIVYIIKTYNTMDTTFINLLHNRITSVQNLHHIINVVNKQTIKQSHNEIGENKINQLLKILEICVYECSNYYPDEIIYDVLSEKLIGWNNQTNKQL